ncbi:hypothetical protein CR513_16387, partial [Mucuna pruriens]
MVKLHEKACIYMEKKGEQYAKYAIKGRKGKVFSKRKERFPTLRKFNLLPLEDGPFLMLHKINDNAYVLDMSLRWVEKNVKEKPDEAKLTRGRCAGQTRPQG